MSNTQFTAEIIIVQSGLYVVLLAVICQTNCTLPHCVMQYKHFFVICSSAVLLGYLLMHCLRLNGKNTLYMYIRMHLYKLCVDVTLYPNESWNEDRDWAQG